MVYRLLFVALEFNFRKSDKDVSGFVELPKQVLGTPVVNVKTIDLKAGKNMIP